MTRRLGVVMDPISEITPHKDSSFAMLLEAGRRGWQCDYLELTDLRLRDGTAWGRARPLSVRDTATDWFELGAPQELPLADFDMLLMRKDPPVDLEFITATWILEAAEREGTLVVNRASSLRDANEKLAAMWFPGFTPPTLVTRDGDALRAFIEEHEEVVLKPLELMGGRLIVRTAHSAPDRDDHIAALTHRGQRTIVAQRYLPRVTEVGDSRILLVDGEAVPGVLGRIPAAGDFRANLAAGGRAEPRALTTREQEICAVVGPVMRERGLWFVGLDVVDGWLTEVNVTSPTGIRQIDHAFGFNVAGMLFDRLEALRPSR